jgi:CRP-like cAMP-binding protein
MAIGVALHELDRNRVLAPLPTAERTRLAAALEPYESAHELLVPAGGRIPYAYFPSDGMISVVAALKNGRRTEVATVAREGMAGLPLFLGSETSLYEVISQVAGRGLRMAAATFCLEATRNPVLRTRLLRYAELRMAMLGQTAACNANHRIAARLARWLLISHDSVDGDTFVLTHEFLSQMLGSERPSVTLSAGTLQKLGCITYKRGAVQVTHRGLLERAACECYEVVRRETERLMETDPRAGSVRLRTDSLARPNGNYPARPS